MRHILPIAAAALASFVLGFAGIWWMDRASPPAGESRAVTLAPAQKSVPRVGRTDESPAASKERIDAVIANYHKDSGPTRDHDLYAALRKLDARDFPAGAEAMLALLNPSPHWISGSNRELCEAWIDCWLDVDAPGALRFLGTSPFLEKIDQSMKGMRPEDRAYSLAGAPYQVLARWEPDWTFQYLAGKPPGADRDVGIYVLLEQTARQDSAKARQFLASFSDGVNRRDAVQGFVAGLSEGNARASFDVAMAEAAGPFRQQLLMTAMGGASSRGVATVSELLDRIDDPEFRRKLAARAVWGIANGSRENPLPWIVEESRRPAMVAGWKDQYDQWSGSIAGAVQGANVAAAADWAASLAEDSEKKTLGKIAYDWAWRNPDSLREWLEENASTLDATAMEKLSGGIERMTEEDAGAVRAWADSLPPGGLRDQVRFQIALDAGAKSDLARAASAYESVAANDLTGALAKQLATVLAKQDGSVAAEWAMRRPAGPARAAAITAVAGQWGQRDPHGAAAWIGQMPGGNDRDAAVREYAGKVVYADPAAAAEWVGQVADPSVRAEAAESVFWVWSMENPAASREWLRALTGVDEAWKVKFEKRVK